MHVLRERRTKNTTERNGYGTRRAAPPPAEGVSGSRGYAPLAIEFRIFFFSFPLSLPRPLSLLPSLSLSLSLSLALILSLSLSLSLTLTLTRSYVQFGYWP